MSPSCHPVGLVRRRPREDAGGFLFWLDSPGQAPGASVLCRRSGERGAQLWLSQEEAAGPWPHSWEPSHLQTQRAGSQDKPHDVLPALWQPTRQATNTSAHQGADVTSGAR